MIRAPRRLALFLTGFSGLFGMRTPPEPEVIAHMAPAKGPVGKGPDGFGEPPPDYRRGGPRRPPGPPDSDRKAGPDASS